MSIRQDWKSSNIFDVCFENSENRHKKNSSNFLSDAWKMSFSKMIILRILL